MNSVNNNLPVIKPVMKKNKVVKKIWQTAGDHCFNSPVDGAIKFIPTGFKFDGATIPALFWWPLRLHPFSPRIITAALEHDFCYYLKLDRKKSDKLFYRNLRKYGINKVRAWVMYRAVRLAGWVFYLPNNHWFKKSVIQALG